MKANVLPIREQPKEGPHLARIVSLTNLGHQPGFTYQGQEIKSSDKIEITYELVNHLMTDGRPFWVSESISNSRNEKGTLYVRTKATGVSFDCLDELINKPVMVTVKHNDKGYASIAGQAGVSGIPEGMVVSELQNKSYVFDPFDKNVDIDLFNSFSDFKKKKIMDALNFPESELAARLTQSGELPF